jgi:cysteinyl-tRNA synthetase
MAAAQNGLQHLRNQVRTLIRMPRSRPASTMKAIGKVSEAINNDLNMPQAMAVVQDLLKSDLAPG